MTAQQKKIVVLTGAGMSAESGFATFRDSGGLWETHPVEQVATPEGWQRDPNFVNEFYNGLRRQLVEARPNRGHELLAELENDFDVRIVTQNVDDLHERAGSSQVLHLLAPPHLDILPGQKAGDGSLLRPYIVWFGESVPLIERAAEWVAAADALVIVGTSLVVYPAAGLVRCVRPGTPIFLIDPQEVEVPDGRKVHVIRAKASEGLAQLRDALAQC